MADEETVDDEVEDDELYYHFSATLRIFGVIEDLDEISSKLNLQPTWVHKRGEPINRRLSRPHDMWSYEAPVPEDRPLDVHIQTLWSHIRAHKEYLLKLKEKLTVDVFCGYRSNSCTAGFEVSHKSLELFTELEIPFGVSVIIT